MNAILNCYSLFNLILPLTSSIETRAIARSSRNWACLRCTERIGLRNLEFDLRPLAFTRTFAPQALTFYRGHEKKRLTLAAWRGSGARG